MKLKIGHLYRISGEGVMKLIDLHQPKPGRTTCNFITAGAGLNVWVSEEDVMGEADAEYLRLYIANSRRAGFHANADGVERWLRNPKGIGPGMIGNAVEEPDPDPDEVIDATITPEGIKALDEFSSKPRP